MSKAVSALRIHLRVTCSNSVHSWSRSICNFWEKPGISAALKVFERSRTSRVALSLSRLFSPGTIGGYFHSQLFFPPNVRAKCSGAICMHRSCSSLLVDDASDSSSSHLGGLGHLHFCANDRIKHRCQNLPNSYSYCRQLECKPDALTTDLGRPKEHNALVLH